MELVLTDENFDKEIQQSKIPVLVDFFAVWCEPCSMLAPVLKNIAKEMEGKLILAKANLDESPLTAQKFGIEKIPTVVLFNNGKPIGGFVGLAQAESIKEWLKKSIDGEQEKNDVLPQDNTEKIAELEKQYADYAKANGFNLNPDKKTVERIIKGLLKNEKKYGKKYCPCRRVTGKEEEDSKKICPCVWHKDEITKDGKCFCGLYVK